MSEIEKLAEQLAGQPPLEIEFEYSSDYWTALGKWKHDRLMAWKGAAAVIELIRERMPGEWDTTNEECREVLFAADGWKGYRSEILKLLDNIK